MKKINIIIFLLSILSYQLFAQQIRTINGKSYDIKGNLVATGYQNSQMEDRTFKYKPSGNTKDLFMSVENIIARLTIIGSDRSDIELQAKDLIGLPKKAEGLRAVSKFGEDNTKMEINLSQTGNEIRLVGTNVKRIRQAEYTMIVPKDITLTIVNMNWGGKDVMVKNIKGGVEVIVSSNNVRLEEVSGPLSISSNSGNIEVVYDGISSEAITVFSTSSGDVDITLAESSNVDFNISQTSGEVFTDLDIDFTTVKPDEKKDVKLRNNQANLTYANQLARVVSMHASAISKARMNNGGTRIDINTIAGDVYLRKK